MRVREIRYNGVKLRGSITAETHPEFVTGTGRIISKTGVFFLVR